MIRQISECIAFSLGVVLGGLQQGDSAFGGLQDPHGMYRSTSLGRNTTLLGPCSMIIPRVIWWSYGGGGCFSSVWRPSRPTRYSSSSCSLLSSLDLCDMVVYEPQIRALLATASQFCEIVVLKSRTVLNGTTLTRYHSHSFHFNAMIQQICLYRILFSGWYFFGFGNATSKLRWRIGPLG